jgi:hypothetical protein
MTQSKTYGEAISDPGNPLRIAVDQSDSEREKVLAELAAQGITGETAWMKIIAEGLLR